MPSLRWILSAGGALGVLVVLGLCVGLAWLNSFIHSDAFRHEVETRAGKTLGATVEITQINLNLWGGVKLSGVAAKLNSTQGTIVSQIESIDCYCSILGLLERRLQLKSVTLVNPQIVLTQEPPSRVPIPAAPPVASTSSAEQAQSGKTSSIQVVLESAKLENGSLAIRDASGATKANLQGIQVNAKTGGFFTEKGIAGKLRITQVSLPENLSLNDFSAPFSYKGGNISANPLAGSSYSGKLSGDYKLDASGPSLLEVNLSRLDLAQMAQAANPASANHLSGSLDLQSKWHGVETGKLTGEGDAQITSGRLTGVGILHDLAFALRIRGLSDPNLRSVTVHFEVENGTTRFNDLRIESDDFEMTGDGVIDAQGRLNANMVLTLHGAAMGGIPGAAAALFSRLPGGGGSIPIHMGGTVANPHADLTSQLLLQAPLGVEKSLRRTMGHFLP